MSIQAIIMAGGAGTRLQPLTCHSPKPLAPLCGAPIMDYTLRLLQRHHFDRADVTLWYRPQDIRNRFGPRHRGIDLGYVVEDKPVGTAGSILLAAGSAAHTVLVLSGDGLTDIDLSAALAFHRQHRAAATLVLRQVAIPLEYGVVVTERDGRITRFIEKPDWSRVISSLVNTGVYLLEPEALALIPRDAPFDFGRDLFPLMLQKGLPLYGYETQAYWCDVGNPSAFLQAQADLLLGRTSFAVEDRGLRNAAGCTISDDSYVSSSAQLMPGVQLRRSCVMGGAVICREAQLDSAIVCERARVEQGATLQEGSILGAGAAAGAFSTLRHEASIWPGIAVPTDACVEEALRRPPAGPVVRGFAPCASPMEVSRAAAAFLSAGDRKSAAVMHDGSLDVYCSALGALSAYGADPVFMLGQGSLGMLSRAVRVCNAAGGLLCRGDGLVMLDQNGLRLDASAGAAVDACLTRQQFAAPRHRADALRAHPLIGSRYIQELARQFYCEHGVTAALQCGSRFLSQIARSAMALAGHTVRSQGEITIKLEEESAQVLLSGQPITPLQQWQLCARALRERGETVYDTAGFGLADALPCDESEACRRQQQLMQDGLAQALLLLQFFAREAPEKALAALPQAAHRQVAIPCEAGDKGRVMAALLPEAVPLPRGGLSARHGDARALIHPDPALPLMHVAVSALSAETAGELCDFYAGKVLQAMRGKE